MSQRTDKHAILLFARSPESEASHKLLNSNSVVNYRLLKETHERTLKEIGRVKLPIFVFDENNQDGIDFGEKLANSIQSVFEQGFEKVLIVGSDCPLLQYSDLNSALTSLQFNQSVIGPDRRGGVYLIGLSKEIFDNQQFRSLAWQSSELAATLLAYFVRHDAVLEILERKCDLNTSADVKYSLSIKWLRDKLNEMFQTIRLSMDHFSVLERLLAFGIDHRGPPQLN